MMGWPRTTSSFPEPTWWNGDDDRAWGADEEEESVAKPEYIFRCEIVNVADDDVIVSDYCTITDATINSPANPGS